MDSGVRALNTGGGGTRASGVLGLGGAEPDAWRRELDVEGSCRTGGIRDEEATGAAGGTGAGGLIVLTPDSRCDCTCAGVLSAVAVLADSLACRELTFLVRLSTLDASFFFSLRRLTE